jgi:hypothetical protein
MIGGGSSLYSPEIPPLSLQSFAAWSSFGNVCCSILDLVQQSAAYRLFAISAQRRCSTKVACKKLCGVIIV